MQLARVKGLSLRQVLPRAGAGGLWAGPPARGLRGCWWVGLGSGSLSWGGWQPALPSPGPAAGGPGGGPQTPVNSSTWALPQRPPCPCYLLAPAPARPGVRSSGRATGKGGRGGDVRGCAQVGGEHGCAGVHGGVLMFIWGVWAYMGVCSCTGGVHAGVYGGVNSGMYGVCMQVCMGVCKPSWRGVCGYAWGCAQVGG